MRDPGRGADNQRAFAKKEPLENLRSIQAFPACAWLLASKVEIGQTHTGRRAGGQFLENLPEKNSWIERKRECRIVPETWIILSEDQSRRRRSFWFPAITPRRKERVACFMSSSVQGIFVSAGLPGRTRSFAGTRSSSVLVREWFCPDRQQEIQGGSERDGVDFRSSSACPLGRSSGSLGVALAESRWSGNGGDMQHTIGASAACFFRNFDRQLARGIPQNPRADETPPAGIGCNAQRSRGRDSGVAV